LYGGHKAEAEEHVVSSDLEWVILRLGGVISVEPGAMPFTGDALFFESALPTDGRIHTVDVRGVASACPAGRPGDTDSDENWFVTDWLDTTRAQQALSFQHHSWPDMLAEMRAIVGWKRYPMSFAGPVVRQFLKRQAAYRDAPGRYAD